MYELLSGSQQSCQRVVSDSGKQARKKKKGHRCWKSLILHKQYWQFQDLSFFNSIDFS